MNLTGICSSPFLPTQIVIRDERHRRGQLVEIALRRAAKRQVRARTLAARLRLGLALEDFVDDPLRRVDRIDVAEDGVGAAPAPARRQDDVAAVAFDRDACGQTSGTAADLLILTIVSPNTATGSRFCTRAPRPLGSSRSGSVQQRSCSWPIASIFIGRTDRGSQRIQAHLRSSRHSVMTRCCDCTTPESPAH